MEWEADCDLMKATMEQFVSWLEGGATEPSHPLNRYDPDTRWCYCDYKHIPKEFPDKPELLKVGWPSCCSFFKGVLFSDCTGKRFMFQSKYKNSSKVQILIQSIEMLIFHMAKKIFCS